MNVALLGITGATGYVDGHVAAQLASRGLPQRLIVRDAERAPDLPNSEIALAESYSDEPSMRRALQGVTTDRRPTHLSP